MNYFYQRILFVVLNSEFTIQRSNLYRIPMNARGCWSYLEINRLCVVAAQVKLFSFDGASIFANTNQGARCPIAIQTDKRIDIKSRTDKYTEGHTDAREFSIHRSGCVADANCENGNVARA